MSKYCIRCGAALSQGAKFCEKCGRPVEITPPTAEPPPVEAHKPQSTQPKRRKGVLIAALAAGGVGLCTVVALGVLFLINRGVIPGPENLFGGPDITAHVEIDADSLAALEESVGQLEAAFRAGDVTTVIELTHPAMRADYQPIFAAHQTELERVAELLSTRELIYAAYDIAEYEVTEEGRTFSVIFEPWGDIWYLSSF